MEGAGQRTNCFRCGCKRSDQVLKERLQRATTGGLHPRKDPQTFHWEAQSTGHFGGVGKMGLSLELTQQLRETAVGP